MRTVWQYSYFWGVAFETLVAGAAYLAVPRQRRMMFISGLVATPLCFAGILHEKIYWNPVRLFGGRLGIEDVLFCFSLGSLVWLAAVWPFRSRITNQLKPFLFLVRLILLCIMGGCLFGIFVNVGTKVMAANIYAQAALAVILVLLRPGQFPLAAAGTLIYSGYYFIVLLVTSLWLPGFFSTWNGSELWSLSLLGIPLEEILWVTTFSACWPLLISYVCDVRIQARRKLEG